MVLLPLSKESYNAAELRVETMQKRNKKEKQSEGEQSPIPVPPDGEPPSPVVEPPPADEPQPPVGDDNPEKDRVRIV